MHGGRPLMDAAPREIFRREEELEQIGLAVPAVTHICGMLAKKGLPVRTDVISMDEAAESIREIFPETLPANA